MDPKPPTAALQYTTVYYKKSIDCHTAGSTFHNERRTQTPRGWMDPKGRTLLLPFATARCRIFRVDGANWRFNLAATTPEAPGGWTGP